MFYFANDILDRMMKGIIGFLVGLTIALVSCQPPGENQELLSQPLLLQIVKGKISLCVDSMHNDMDVSVRRISEHPLNYDLIRSELIRISKNHPYVEDFSFLDSKGVLRVVEPKAYSRYEGHSVVFQKHNKMIRTQPTPVFSDVFKSVEGFDAVDLQVPVNKGKEFYGSLNLLLRPDVFLDDIIRGTLNGLPFQIWIAQPNGKIIYDLDPSLIGRNILTDTLFQRSETIKKLMKQVVGKREGYRKAESDRNGKTYKWENFWTTIDLFNNQWRIVLSREASDLRKPKIQNGILSRDAINREIQFKKLARDEGFLKSIANRDTEAVTDILKSFHSSYPDLYCLEWVNEEYKVVAGFPKENSIIGYSFDPIKNQSDVVMQDKVNSMRESKFNMQLFEGHYGKFYVYPMFYNGKYFGLIYYIVTAQKSEGNYIL